ncbi:hypothetical protein T8J41_13665 [Nitratireductor rhodophyticola]|uniref:hypothetical protein n=1 Tax=Nitratireductor rhodophyticola TaxID=2854036 RepID=UPI002AC8B66C|nr:hypothetical protein [Nitratireductor rhodophyticola]WPZ13203.1 hypothetical protein T8J41_13665 [Nitratireductor rhodophyticola]
MKLTKAQRTHLANMAKSNRPLFGGLLARGGRSPDIAGLLAESLISEVEHTRTVRGHLFGGGYVITMAGRRALEGQP